jgi:hypothetical protein
MAPSTTWVSSGLPWDMRGRAGLAPWINPPHPCLPRCAEVPPAHEGQ